MRQKVFFLLAGMALGMVLLSGSTALASTVLTATPSNQEFYIDGRRVTLTAYQIGGNNYLKLRDIGQAVGFNVYWDGTVQIESDKPYTGIAPVNQALTPTRQTQTAPTPESAQAAIKALRNTYPPNAVYPTPYIPNNPLSRPYSNCDHCAGWAMLCSDAAFGDLPWRYQTNPAWSEIRAGDLVRYDKSSGGHVVVVIDKTDDYILVTESGSNDKVRWSGQYFRTWLEAQPGYAMWTRYPQ